MRYSKLNHNVWLQKKEHDTKCFVLNSKNAKNNVEVGTITEQNCESGGATVCEISTNKPSLSKSKANEFNQNEYMLPNKRIKFSNGTLSEIFTGVYYLITSKFNNTVFSNSRLAGVSYIININIIYIEANR